MISGDTVEFFRLLHEADSDSSPQLSTAISYQTLGQMHFVSGDYQQSEKFFRESIAIFESLPSESHPYELAKNHFLLGTRCENKNDLPMQRSTCKMRSTGMSRSAQTERWGVSFYRTKDCFLALLDVKHQHGTLEELERTGKQLRDLLEVIPDPDSTFANFIRIQVGQALWNANLHNDATAVWREASRREPQDVTDYDALAWLFATSPSTQIRDSKRAVAIGCESCRTEPEHWRRLVHLGSGTV